MQSRRLVCLVAAASLGLGSLSAFAQDGRRWDHDRGQHRGWSRPHDDHGAMGNRGERGREHDREWDRGGHDRDDDRHGRDWDRGDRRGHETYYYGARGPEWRRGGRLPPLYRNHQYVVNDWRAHHLHRPPRGYEWVQVGNDYVLAAIATGIIVQLILDSSY